MNFLKSLLSDESFLGVSSLMILGILCIIYDQTELGGVAVGGIAALLRGQKSQGEN